MFHKLARTGSAVLFFTVFGVGCSSESAKRIVGINESQPSDLTTTVVYMNPDGSIARQEVFKTYADGTFVDKNLDVETACNGNDNWYYDAYVNSLCSGMRLCVIGTGGPLDLSGVDHGNGTNWAGRVLCLKSEETNGHFRDSSLGGACGDFPHTYSDYGWGGVSNYLYQGSSCCTGTKHWCDCSLCEDSSGCATMSACTLGTYCPC
jgi:hypothetical protein